MSGSGGYEPEEGQEQTICLFAMKKESNPPPPPESSKPAPPPSPPPPPGQSSEVKDFLEGVTHGIIAVEKQAQGQLNQFKILHFCGYHEPPTIEDRKALHQELNTDPSFGLVGRLDVDVFLMDAPEEVIESMKKEEQQEKAAELDAAYIRSREKIQYTERQRFWMQPDMYDGDTFDQHRPTWWTSYPKEGDQEHCELLELKMLAGAFPPGTEVIIRIPTCPNCGEPADMISPKTPGRLWPPCQCGFDWNIWAEEKWS